MQGGYSAAPENLHEDLVVMDVIGSTVLLSLNMIIDCSALLRGEILEQVGCRCKNDLDRDYILAYAPDFDRLGQQLEARKLKALQRAWEWGYGIWGLVN